VRARALALAAREVEVGVEVARVVDDLLAQQPQAVRVEEPAQVGIGEDARRRRVACVLEARQVERDQRIRRRELIDDEDRSARARDACELRDEQLRPRRVVQRAQRP
jgi:hypothetical protein